MKISTVYPMGTCSQDGTIGHWVAIRITMVETSFS